jgi:hypothetical protein
VNFDQITTIEMSIHVILIKNAFRGILTSKQQDAAIQKKSCGDNAGLVILTPEEEKILRLQAENKLLKREVDSIQKEVEEIRNSFLK